MPAPRITYQTSKQEMLAGIPMKPSGPISYPKWVDLLNETAQYADADDSTDDTVNGLSGWGSRRPAAHGQSSRRITMRPAIQSVSTTAIYPIQVNPVMPVVAVTQPVPVMPVYPTQPLTINQAVGISTGDHPVAIGPSIPVAPTYIAPVIAPVIPTFLSVNQWDEINQWLLRHDHPEAVAYLNKNKAAIIQWQISKRVSFADVLLRNGQSVTQSLEKSGSGILYYLADLKDLSDWLFRAGLPPIQGLNGLDGLGWGGSFGGAISNAVHRVTNAAHKVTHTVTRPVISIGQRIGGVVTRPVARLGGAAFRPISSFGSSVLRPVGQLGGSMKYAVGSIAGLVPGLNKKPSQAPTDWPAQVNGRTFNNEAEYKKYLATEIYVNPYSHKPISESEYNLWLSAGANNSYVPVGWSVGSPPPTQEQINAMKSPDYADGYRPATDAEFKAYVAAVDAANKAVSSAGSSPTTINQVGSPTPDSRPPTTQGFSWANGALPLMNTATNDPLTINQAAQLPAPSATSVPAASVTSLQPPTDAPLTINQAAQLPTQSAASAAALLSDPSASPAPSKGGAPMGLIAAVGAGAFFLLKK